MQQRDSAMHLEMLVDNYGCFNFLLYWWRSDFGIPFALRDSRESGKHGS